MNRIGRGLAPPIAGRIGDAHSGGVALHCPVAAIAAVSGSTSVHDAFGGRT